MNKSIKRVVAIMLTISGFAVFEPAKYSNIMNLKAYADDDIYLSGISVSDGDAIRLNSSIKTYKTNVPNSDTEVIIRATTNNKDDIVKIDGDVPDRQSDKKYTKTVELNKGINTYDITVENKDGTKERDYTLKINRGGKQSSDADSVFLHNINVDFGNVVFDKMTTDYSFSVPEDADQLRVQGNPENDNYIVKIDGITVDKEENFRREVSLSKGENTISIDVEDDQDDTNTKTYTLNVYRGKDPSKTDDTSDTNVNFDDSQDPIYLDDIVLDDGDVKYAPNFNKRITSYSVDVPESKEDVIVKGTPAYGSDLVKINGGKGDDKNRKRVTLSEGKNVIEVKVNTDCDTDDKDYESRIYTLTVYRGTSEGTSSTANASNEQNTSTAGSNNSQSNVSSNTSKCNQWINVNGKWQYNDSTGNPIKNTWYLDRNYGKYYFLNQDGNMLTGWLASNGSWYYLDQNGAMVTGWKQLGAGWYYLDLQGKMKTGWFKDTNGKWYYLNESGAMSVNTMIGNYKIGADGAWIR